MKGCSNPSSTSSFTAAPVRNERDRLMKGPFNSGVSRVSSRESSVRICPDSPGSAKG